MMMNPNRFTLKFTIDASALKVAGPGGVRVGTEQLARLRPLNDLAYKNAESQYKADKASLVQSRMKQLEKIERIVLPPERDQPGAGRLYPGVGRARRGHCAQLD